MLNNERIFHVVENDKDSLSDALYEIIEIYEIKDCKYSTVLRHRNNGKEYVQYSALIIAELKAVEE